MSTSHFPEDRSHIPDSQRVLLAHYHNAVACAASPLRLYREAKHHLYHALDLQPSSSLYLFNLGVVHYTHRHWELAVKALRMAVKRDDRNLAYHNNLGCALLACREWNKALAAFTRVVDMTGDSNAAAYANLAAGCVRQEKVEGGRGLPPQSTRPRGEGARAHVHSPG